MNKQCTGCAVSAGTHKPAEALHQQIAEPQPEALRLADECEESAANWVNEIDTRLKAAKMLRAQHARIAELEAQAASSQPEDSVCAPSSGKITVAELTQEKLKNFLTYDQETGVFTINSTKKKIGRVGFRGYLTVDVYGTAFRAHRLAWLYMTGTWPKALIDHIDGDVLNNRFSNLREATHSQNVFNAHSKKRNRNLPRGVQKTKGSSTFRAEISDAGKKIHLGCYPSAEEASEVYQLAAEMLHGEFAYHLRDAAIAAQAKHGENQCTSAPES